MLTYLPPEKQIIRQKSCSAFVIIALWIFGTMFFHSAWEPYEPYTFAIVKGIIKNNSWLVPNLGAYPYLELQPFYFWLYAIPIKLLNLHNIANSIRIINSIIIFLTIYITGLVGKKNQLQTMLITIATVGFINNAYQLSPNIITMLGFSLFLYSIQEIEKKPGVAGGILGMSLVLLSLHFTAQYITIAFIILFYLAVFDKRCRNAKFFTAFTLGILLFLMFFCTYLLELYSTNKHFLYEWYSKYIEFFDLHYKVSRLRFYFNTLLWYLIPSWFLVVWTFYKRKFSVFNDLTLTVCIIASVFVFLFAIFSLKENETPIFLIVIPFAILASAEINTIRISIAALFNWFAIVLFSLISIFLILLYLSVNTGHPIWLLKISYLYSPNYIFHINIIHLLIAITTLFTWIFVVLKSHMDGKNVINNWALGTTCCLVLYSCLCLPWLDNVVNFSSLVHDSKKYINQCITTNPNNKLAIALWYYYGDVNLLPENNNNCLDLIIDSNSSDNVIWKNKRAIDKKYYKIVK